MAWRDRKQLRVRVEAVEEGSAAAIGALDEVESIAQREAPQTLEQER
ncbi:MAG: hypothetical protein R3B40_09230 [Polyangiales bacterium]|nr:hypothetical protein [Myxococcales bacterium]